MTFYQPHLLANTLFKKRASYQPVPLTVEPLAVTKMDVVCLSTYFSKAQERAVPASYVLEHRFNFPMPLRLDQPLTCLAQGVEALDQVLCTLVQPLSSLDQACHVPNVPHVTSVSIYHEFVSETDRMASFQERVIAFETVDQRSFVMTPQNKLDFTYVKMFSELHPEFFEVRMHDYAPLRRTCTFDWVEQMHDPKQAALYQYLHAKITDAVMTHLKSFFGRQDKVFLYNFGCGEAEECRAVAQQHLAHTRPSKKLVMCLYDNTPGLLRGASEWTGQLNKEDTTRFSGYACSVDLLKQFPKNDPARPIDIFVASGFLNQDVLPKREALALANKIISRMLPGSVGIVTGLSYTWITRDFLIKQGCEVLQMTVPGIESNNAKFGFYVFRKL